MGKINEVRQLGREKVIEINDQLDGMARSQFVGEVAKDEGVSMEEAIEMCNTVPKYSLGYKMASPAMLRMASSKKYVGKFKEMLTPEELEIFEKEVEPMGLKGIIKSEMKRKKKEKGTARSDGSFKSDGSMS